MQTVKPIGAANTAFKAKRKKALKSLTDALDQLGAKLVSGQPFDEAGMWGATCSAYADYTEALTKAFFKFLIPAIDPARRPAELRDYGKRILDELHEYWSDSEHFIRNADDRERGWKLLENDIRNHVNRTCKRLGAELNPFEVEEAYLDTPKDSGDTPIPQQNEAEPDRAQPDENVTDEERRRPAPSASANAFDTEEKREAAIAAYIKAWKCTRKKLAENTTVGYPDLNKWKLRGAWAFSKRGVSAKADKIEREIVRRPYPTI